MSFVTFLDDLTMAQWWYKLAVVEEECVCVSKGHNPQTTRAVHESWPPPTRTIRGRGLTNHARKPALFSQSADLWE